MSLWIILITIIAVILGIIAINLSLKYDRLQEKYKLREIFNYIVTLNGDTFKFKTGDEFYYAISSSDGSMEAMKEVCHGVTIRGGNIYITYFTHSMYCFSDMYSVLYDICGKTEAEAIEKMRKKICKG